MNDTEEQLTHTEEAEAEAFVRMVAKNLPNVMDDEQVLKLCAILITAYATSDTAINWLKSLTVLLAQFYADQVDGRCNCEHCRAKRNMH